MNILRKFQKTIKRYEMLLQENQEEAKKGKNDFIKDVELIKKL